MKAILVKATPWSSAPWQHLEYKNKPELIKKMFDEIHFSTQKHFSFNIYNIYIYTYIEIAVQKYGIEYFMKLPLKRFCEFDAIYVCFCISRTMST